jgi:hypothetical protein
MLRDGAPSHELRPQLTRAKRNRDRISPLVSRIRAARLIPPIGGYSALLAWAFAKCGRSQRPRLALADPSKALRKLQAAIRRGVVKQILRMVPEELKQNDYCAGVGPAPYFSELD